MVGVDRGEGLQGGSGAHAGAPRVSGADELPRLPCLPILGADQRAVRSWHDSVVAPRKTDISVLR
jgi:hypothetical protein